MRIIATGRQVILVVPYSVTGLLLYRMPKVERQKCPLVTVDHLTNWVEAIPLPRAMAINVTNVILEHSIPRFGLVKT